MITVTNVTHEQIHEYDTFVAAHSLGTFLQARDWGAFQAHQGQQVAQYVMKENNVVIASVQVLIKTAPRINKQYLYAPYGPLFLPGVDIQPLVKRIALDFPNAILIRLEPTQSLAITGRKTIRTQPPSTLITNLAQTEDELLTGMHHKARYNIKVARKHGVDIHIVDIQNNSEVASCLELFSATGQRQGFKDYSRDYYQTLLKALSGSHTVSAQLYSAVYNNQTIATAIIIDFAQTRTYLFGGSSDEHKNVMAPYLLHWQAMLDAKAQGKTKYDWWGLETATGNTAGFAQFKLRFGGETINYPPAVDIVQNRAWYTIYTILRKVNRFF